MRIGYIGIGEAPKIKEIEPDEQGSYLHAMQKLVGGHIEFFECLYGTHPALIVNDEGLYTSEPNRAVYANARMEAEGFLDAMTYSHPIVEGELYTILYGPILAVPIDWDEEGNEVHRDITDAEFATLERDFSDPDSGISAMFEVLFSRFTRQSA